MTNWHLSPILERYLGDGSYAAVVTLAAGLLIVWFASILFTSVPLARRCVLAGLRLAVIAVLVVVMLRPERVYTTLEKKSATLIMLLDGSRSMVLDDTLSGESRWQVLAKSLASAADTLKHLAEKVEVRIYTFGSEVHEVALKDGTVQLDESPKGEQSAYGDAMNEVLLQEDGKRLVGFILAGDGAQQSQRADAALPQSAARQLAMLECPLYTVSFGRRPGGRQKRDVVLESMPDDLVVFVKNRLSVSGTMRVSGYTNRDIPVKLIVETNPGTEDVVATETYRATSDDQQIRYELDYVPETPGQFKIKVRATPQEGEVTLTNNELPTYLTVIDGGVSVLYLQGEIRREQTFLRRSLDKSPDINVTLLTLHTRDRRQWPLNSLRKYFTPGKFDVIVLGDVDSKAFHPGDNAGKRPADLKLLATAVERGAGLLLLGGWHTFRPGGFHNTPLSNVLPIRMDTRTDRFVRQNFDERLDPEFHLQGPLKMKPSRPWGVDHFVMQLAASNDSIAAWEQLPPLSGANKFRGTKEGAVVLAEDQDGNPLLVEGEPGGRVIAFAGDSTWRWAMHGEEQAHRRFWRQVILRLAKKDDASEGIVWLRLDGRRFAPRSNVTFSVGARSTTGDTLAEATVNANLVMPGGKRRPIRLVRHGDHLRGSILDVRAPGTYVVEATAQQNGKEIGTNSARFLVYSKDRELGGTTADPVLMQNLARETHEQGGRKIAPEELPQLLEEFASKPLDMEEKVAMTVTYWDRWPVIWLFAALLSVEWFLRKRWELP